MKLQNKQRITNEVHKCGRRFYFFVLLAFCAITSGCFPYHYTTSPGLSGTVVSAENHQPLVGAVISYLGRTNNITAAFSTENGSFAVLPKREWGIWIIPQDVFSLPYTISISHIGYETNYVKFSFSVAMTGKKATKQFGVVALKPLSQ